MRKYFRYLWSDECYFLIDKNNTYDIDRKSNPPYYNQLHVRGMVVSYLSNQQVTKNISSMQKMKIPAIEKR